MQFLQTSILERERRTLDTTFVAFHILLDVNLDIKLNPSTTFVFIEMYFYKKPIIFNLLILKIIAFMRAIAIRLLLRMSAPA